jgi:hypothetical protein
VGPISPEQAQQQALTSSVLSHNQEVCLSGNVSRVIWPTV